MIVLLAVCELSTITGFVRFLADGHPKVFHDFILHRKIELLLYYGPLGTNRVERLDNLSVLKCRRRHGVVSYKVRWQGSLNSSAHLRTKTNMLASFLPLFALALPSVLAHGQVRQFISSSGVWTAADAYGAANSSSPIRKLNTYGPAANFIGANITCGVSSVYV